MAQVGNIIFSISADLKNLQGQLRTMEGNFNTSFSKIESLAGTFGAGILKGLVGGLSVAALTSFTKGVADLGDQLSDLSDQTGLTIQVLGGIKPILDANNSSLEGFAKGFAKFQKQLGDFQGEGKQAAEVLRAIKLDPAQLVNLAPDQALEKLVNALAKVENRNQRLAFANTLLSKSAAELIPTILQLAENGIPKLDNATAQAYKRLGELKDQFVQIGAAISNIAAPPLAGFIDLLQLLRVIPTAPLDQLRNAVKSAREEVDLLNTKIQNTKDASSISFGVFSSPETREGRRQEQLTQLQGQRNAALEKFIDLNSKLIQQEMPKAAGTAKSLIPTNKEASDAGTKKLQTAVDNYRESLVKVITQQEIEEVKLRAGDQAALQASQAYQVLALKASLAADKLPIPPEIGAAAVAAENTLKSLGANVEILSEKNFAKLQTAALEGARQIEVIKVQMERLAEVAKAMSQDSAEWLNVDSDIGEARKKAEEEIASLEKALTLEVLTESDRRREIIEREFQERVKLIQEVGRMAGKTEAEITALIAQAGQARAQAQQQTTDQLTTFQTRAFERMHDALADIVKDGLNGQIKSWADLGKRIQQVLSSILSDYIAMQAKIALFGPNFGSSAAGGAQMGGLIGQLGGWLGGLFGSSSAPTSAIGGAFDTENLIWGAAAVAHKGGPIDRLPRYHVGGGLRSDERLIVGQTGEHMMNRMAVSSIGSQAFDQMNRTGTLPSGGNNHNEFHFHGVQDAESFRRSRAQISADLARAVAKGQKQL